MDLGAILLQPPVLAIDCAGSALDLAVRHEGETSSVRVSAAQSHDELIGEAVASLLLRVGLTVSDLKGVIAGGGPGSFTGVRIALSFAIGVCWSNRCPLVMALSPLGAAWSLCGDGRDVVVLSSAGKQLLFLTRIRGQDVPMVVGEPVVVPYGDASMNEAVREMVCGSVLVWCEDAPLPAEISPLAAPPPSVATGLLSAVLDSPQSEGQEKWLRFYQGTESLASVAPFYVRPVAAKSIAERAVHLK